MQPRSSEAVNAYARMTTAIACNLSAGTQSRVVRFACRSLSTPLAGCVPGLDSRVSSEREPRASGAAVRRLSMYQYGHGSSEDWHFLPLWGGVPNHNTVSPRILTLAVLLPSMLLLWTHMHRCISLCTVDRCGARSGTGLCVIPGSGPPGAVTQRSCGDETVHGSELMVSWFLLWTC